MIHIPHTHTHNERHLMYIDIDSYRKKLTFWHSNTMWDMHIDDTKQNIIASEFRCVNYYELWMKKPREIATNSAKR